MLDFTIGCSLMSFSKEQKDEIKQIKDYTSAFGYELLHKIFHLEENEEIISASFKDTYITIEYKKFFTREE